jgi:hypothetical protein
VREPRNGGVTAAGGFGGEEAAARCGPPRATTTPASTAPTATAAIAHTHRGGRGQLPNSTGSLTAHLASW